MRNVEFLIKSIAEKDINYFFLLENNLYYSDYNFDQHLIFEILPEITLIFFICYSLVNLFNDKKFAIFQYYKWISYLVFILFILIFKFSIFKYTISELILGFSWLTSYYILISKILIVFLTLLILLVCKTKIIRFSQLGYFIEFPLVIGFSVLFIFLLLSSYDFFTTYLTVEGLSLTLYILASLLHQGVISIESAIKYFSLGAIASGNLLLGVVLLFGLVGSLDFLEIQNFLGSQIVLNYIFEIKISLTLIFFSFFFKISAFPCHIWVADVYEGIWSPITAFFAIVIKASLILFFIRLVFDVLVNVLVFFQPLFIVVSLGSMFVGSFLALKQVRIKRFLAYTSISQVGFILLGITSGTFLGLFASIMYLSLYLIMNLMFFTIFLNIEHIIIKKNIIYLSDLYSISSFNNEIAKHLALTILSMAGLPPFGGFIGKLFLYFAVIEARLDFILVVSLLISLISAYYYLNFVRYIFFEKRSETKLYYYIQRVELTFFLRLFSFFLVTFPIFLSNYIDFFLKLSFSCIFPFIFF
uniref:NADH dehydrogenase subunit 2 n=1 Tax=Rhizaria sp. TaxID=2204297 RepID=A0A5P8DJV5_9EUKA|nr:NADH dehydrogenase subunit 2 [Rhizaria sp.]